MKHLFYLILFAILPHSLYGQEDSTLRRLSTFVNNIQVFNHLYPQEKVYLHFDNTGYFLGETVWFKAYVTTAADLKPTPMSRVLYVELLNADGYVVSTQKLRIENGQADGGIPLKRLGMKSGFYEVRAYTRPMLNWSSENLFSRVFPVFETPAKEGNYQKKKIRTLPPSYYKVSPKRAKTPNLSKLNVQFFPEGGYLVKGLASNVAFKVTDKEGVALEATGCIRNTQGDTLSVFSTIHEGMGSFMYTPEGNQNKIWIQCKGEKKAREFELPNPLSTGCVMQIQSLHPEFLRIRIHGTEGITSLPLGLTVMCRGKAHYFKTIDPASLISGYSLDIPKSDLPGGVNQITLFTPEGAVLSERLAYIPHEEHARISIHSQKNEYKPFDAIPLEVAIHDAKGNPLETSFSLAVRDETTEIPSIYKEDIRSNLLLSSDLKGYIVNPGFYFENDDRFHRLSLDLLMLTQGYRRYNWSQMAGLIPFSPVQPIEKGILIKGDVKSITRKKLKEGLDVKMIFYSDSGYQSARCVSDTEGRFNFLAEDFYGKWNLQLETWKKKKREECWITLDRDFSPQGKSYSFYDTYLPQIKPNWDKSELVLTETDSQKEAEKALRDSLELAGDSEGAKMLKEVVVKGKNDRTTIWNEGASIVYDVSEEEDKLEDAAKEYNERIYEFLENINPYFTYDPVRGSFYKGRKVIFKIAGRAQSNISTGGSDPGSSLLSSSSSTENTESVQNTPTSSGTTNNDNTEMPTEIIDLQHKDDLGSVILNMLNSSDIASMAILENPSYYLRLYPELAATNGSNIVVIELILNPTRAKSREPVGVRLTTLQGFSTPHKFYSPNYSEVRLPEESDFRRTLYWNPNIKTNSQGKASVQFFNNSSCKKMSISAETITPEGLPGSLLIE